eukprot:3308049-Rhodomonas_salina.1
MHRRRSASLPPQNGQKVPISCGHLHDLAADLDVSGVCDVGRRGRPHRDKGSHVSDLSVERQLDTGGRNQFHRTAVSVRHSSRPSATSGDRERVAANRNDSNDLTLNLQVASGDDDRPARAQNSDL